MFVFNLPVSSSASTNRATNAEAVKSAGMPQAMAWTGPEDGGVPEPRDLNQDQQRRAYLKIKI